MGYVHSFDKQASPLHQTERPFGQQSGKFWSSHYIAGRLFRNCDRTPDVVPFPRSLTKTDFVLQCTVSSISKATFTASFPSTIQISLPIIFWLISQFPLGFLDGQQRVIRSCCRIILHAREGGFHQLFVGSAHASIVVCYQILMMTLHIAFQAKRYSLCTVPCIDIPCIKGIDSQSKLWLQCPRCCIAAYPSNSNIWPWGLSASLQSLHILRAT